MSSNVSIFKWLPDYIVVKCLHLLIFNKHGYKKIKISNLSWNKCEKMKEVRVDTRISINKK